MGARVLVADDSGVMRKVIARTLESLGVSTVVEAGDGAQAAEEFDRGGFDLVLTDWNMPKMNGLELLKTIRARDAKTPVMLITTERERGQVMDAITAGVTDYLTKPFTPDSLGEKLKKYLPAAS